MFSQTISKVSSPPPSQRSNNNKGLPNETTSAGGNHTIMSSIAKACVDLSNNIRSLRFSKSASPPPSTITNSSEKTMKMNSTGGGGGGSVTGSPILPHSTNMMYHTIPGSAAHYKLTNSVGGCGGVGGGGGGGLDLPASPLLYRTTSPSLPTRGTAVAAIKQRLFNQGLRIDLSPRRRRKTRYKNYMNERIYPLGSLLVNPNGPILPLMYNENFMKILTQYFSAMELCTMALVSKHWYEFLCKGRFCKRIHVCVDYNLLRVKYPCLFTPLTQNFITLARLSTTDNNDNSNNIVSCCLISSPSLQPPPPPLAPPLPPPPLQPPPPPLSSNVTPVSGLGGMKTVIISEEWRHIYDVIISCMIKRGISEIALKNLRDDHVIVFLQAFSSHFPLIQSLRIVYANVTDRSLTRLTETLTSLESLELSCCNDFTEVCFWSALMPNITRITVTDCINMSDEGMGAICQLLPHLEELNLQAYHVTDLALNYLAEKQKQSLRVLRLTQCMEVTNQGLMSVAKGLPDVRVLSLYGCTKVTDDGLDVICENMRMLTSLDLSWCNKITDSGLECVACDLQLLEELILDRCVAVTDMGISYLATLPSLRKLYLRWCLSITDTSILHILSMPGLSYLSLAGCKKVSSDGLCALVRHNRFRFIELTNCPSATPQVIAFLEHNIPNCLVIK